MPGRSGRTRTIGPSMPACRSVLPYTFYRIDASKAVVLDNPLHFYAPESGINISGVVMKDVHLPEAKPGHDDWKCAKVSG